jgi:anti-sigma regulatory factor (Ser/Thr protein kinase)
MTGRTRNQAPSREGWARPASKGGTGAVDHAAIGASEQGAQPWTSTAPTPVSPDRDKGASPLPQWSAWDFMELGALPSAVPCARLHARHLLREWNLTQLAESAELVVSELLTNAVKVSLELDPPAPVRLWLLPDGIGILILVWDASPRQPAPRAMTSDDADGGRGLLLVEALSAQWGWYPAAGLPGKVTWALIK